MSAADTHYISKSVGVKSTLNVQDVWDISAEFFYQVFFIPLSGSCDDVKLNFFLVLHLPLIKLKILSGMNILPIDLQ